MIRRVRALWGALRERLEPVPLDDDERIIGWVPVANRESRIVERGIIAVPAPTSEAATTPVDHYAALARDAAATVVVDQGAVHLDHPHPIFDQLVADLAELEAAKLRALRTPTQEFWAIVETLNGYHCTHCLDGDHTQCPGCECGCTLVGAST